MNPVLRDPGLSHRTVILTLAALTTIFAWASIARRTTPDLPPPAKPIADQRAFTVTGGTPGPLELKDAETGRVFKSYTAQQDGFVRSTLGGFIRTRRLHDVDLTQPYTIVRFTDGQLALEDPAMQRRIDLIAFGSMNAAVFRELLDLDRRTQ